MKSLAQKLAAIARPGILVTSNEEYLSLEIVSRNLPECKLIVFRATPTAEDLLSHESEIILGFSEFSETTALLVDQASKRTIQPLVLSQQIFNRALFQNSSGWRAHFNFSIEFLEEHTDLWENV